jgi:hypothetical protein
MTKSLTNIQKAIGLKLSRPTRFGYEIPYQGNQQHEMLSMRCLF